MLAMRVIISILSIMLLIDFSCSHEDHDHHDEHQIPDSIHKLSQDELSTMIDALEKLCHDKALGNASVHGRNSTAGLCDPLLKLFREGTGTSPHDHDNPEDFGRNEISASTWGYAFLACLIISLVGLVAVAIIPLLHKVVYNHLLQFLVSLAIGSLAGDAMLHLIPHAIAPHNHHHHHEHEFHDLGHSGGPTTGDRGHDRRPVWLGLTALGGLFVFFIVERLVGYCSEVKRKKNRGEKYRSSGDVNATNGMMLDAGGDRKEAGGRVAPSANGTSSCEEMLMVIHASKDIKKMAYDAQEEMHKNCDPPPDRRSDRAGPSGHGGGGGQLVDARGGHHHHGHDVPGSVAAVAWMVIVGDGFHNFADGLAIGSAFASSLQDGISTAIAIFCHELPHELGDFAMLLSAGMSGKQALVYNCVSSVLCLIGMCVGVGISNLISATPWIFMAIAGMFIYIALVDMLPEMKSVDPKRGEHPLLHLGLQVLGMLLGCSIMLIIALFEHHIVVPM